jgi:two-component system LytT family response regulator
MMLRAVIIDDEPLARSNLALLLARDPAVEVVGQYASAEEALAALPAARPDLAFLDV